MKLYFLLIFSLNIFATDIVKVGLFDIAPFTYVNEKGELDGVTFKFLKLLEVETGLKFNFTLFPYARLVGNLKDGNIDMAVFYPSSQNTKSFIKLEQTLGNDNIIVLSRNTPSKKLSDLEGKVIARIRGGKYYDDFDTNEFIKKVDSVNYLQSISLFLAKRVDGFVIPRVALNYLIMTNGLRKEDFENALFLNHKNNFLHVRNGLNDNLKEKLQIGNKEVIKKHNLKKLEDLL